MWDCRDFALFHSIISQEKLCYLSPLRCRTTSICAKVLQCKPFAPSEIFLCLVQSKCTLIPIDTKFGMKGKIFGKKSWYSKVIWLYHLSEKFLATIYDINILEDKLHFRIHSYARKIIQICNMVTWRSLWCYQGLRTLELCVDNLQPDFLYDHIQPVRAELFQVCWLSTSFYVIFFLDWGSSLLTLSSLNIKRF